MGKKEEQALKDHEIAVLVNKLTAIAAEFQPFQSLRMRISEAVRHAIVRAAAECYVLGDMPR